MGTVTREDGTKVYLDASDGSATSDKDQALKAYRDLCDFFNNIIKEDHVQNTKET